MAHVSRSFFEETVRNIDRQSAMLGQAGISGGLGGPQGLLGQILQNPEFKWPESGGLIRVPSEPQPRSVLETLTAESTHYIRNI